MQAEAIAIALNNLFRREAGGTQRPAFFDIDRTCPALRVLDRHLGEIQAELAPLLADHARIPRYHDISQTQSYISAERDPEKNWRVFMLKWFGGDGIEPNRARCPRTVELIEQIPNVLQAFFSILDAGKSIPAHDGVYLGYLRYHLALKVPAHNPPSMRVKDQVHTWKVGESILFDDTWDHEVTNRSDDVRVVLIVDVLRPMRWHLHAINWLVTRFVARHTEEVREATANLKKYA